MKARHFLSVVLIIGVSMTNTSCKSSKRTSRKPATRQETFSSRGIQEKYGSILGVSPSAIRNVALYQFIDDWYGTPYHYGGTTSAGVDCSGFVGNLYREVYRKNIPRTTSLIEKESSRVSKSNLKEGNLVIFDIEGKKSAHIGGYLQNGHFVHASSSKGVIISQLSNPYYEKNFSRGGKL